MGNDQIPEYLFHYTSISNLALILKNKTIRFTRLDKVKDPEEALTKEFPLAKFYTYVSCWTKEDNNKESLSHWKFYTPDMRGVRVRLPINMFKGRHFPENETTGYPIINPEQNIKIKRGRWIYPAKLIGPMKVKYDKNPINNNKCFTKKNNGLLDVELWHLGRNKYDYWFFENEWRFMIIGMPESGTWRESDFEQFFEIPTNDYIDIHLDESIFSELIVQLGPKATSGEDILVRSILKEYGAGAKLCDSDIKIK
jgi:hypothetical protein